MNFIKRVVIIILFFNVLFAYSEEKTNDKRLIFSSLGKFSIQSVYLSFIYISTVEFQIDKQEERNEDIKLVKSVLKINENSLETLRNIKKNLALNEIDIELIDKIIDSTELLIDEIEYLVELIENNQQGILNKINKKHRKTWNSIKELIKLNE